MLKTYLLHLEIETFVRDSDVQNEPKWFILGVMNESGSWYRFYKLRPKRTKLLYASSKVYYVILTQGGIFGQLIGTEPRPVRVSAVASGYADVLQIAIEQFQDNINDEVGVLVNVSFVKPECGLT